MRCDIKFTVRWRKQSCWSSLAWPTRKCCGKAIPCRYSRKNCMMFFLDVAGAGRKFHWLSEGNTRLRWTKAGWHVDSSEGRRRVLVVIVLQRHCIQVPCPCCTTKTQPGCHRNQVRPQLVRVMGCIYIWFAAAGWMCWKEVEGRYRPSIIAIAEAYT